MTRKLRRKNINTCDEKEEKEKENDNGQRSEGIEIAQGREGYVVRKKSSSVGECGRRGN